MNDYNIIFQRIRDRYATCSAETRTRAELHISRLRELRTRYACLMGLSRVQIQYLQAKAVLIDSRQGYTVEHTNLLGIKWEKYINQLNK